MPSRSEFIRVANYVGGVLKTYVDRIPTSSASKDEAIKTLKDPDNTGIAVFLAMLRVIGSRYMAWEPESIWLELEGMGIDLSSENRDKAQAASTLVQAPHFYWDASVFENTVLAFSATPAIAEAIQEATPQELAWGVFEATLISANYAKKEFDFDREPTLYTALSLNRSGFVLAPELLVFAQEELDRFNRGGKDLKETVKSRWDKVDMGKLSDLELGESPEDIQVARLASVHLYLEKKLSQLEQEVRVLA